MAEVERVGVLEWDLESVAQSLHLTRSEVQQYFTDGCRVSFMLERRICRELVKGTLSPSEGAGFDLIDENGRKWEVRSITNSGIYFCPSYMVGSGRKFDEDGFMAKLSEIEGYFVGDVAEFPKIPVYKIPEATVRSWYERGRLGTVTKISRSNALRLLGA